MADIVEKTATVRDKAFGNHLQVDLLQQITTFFSNTLGGDVQQVDKTNFSI
ncbi:MAG: hypothetical protein PHI97_21355 [Desulfobulbus sp.]|nr:hypothetical protein [Desulfobulbus sp.]